MVDFLDSVVEVLLYVNAKIVAVFIEGEKVVPVDEHHLEWYLLGLSIPFFFRLLVTAAMKILRKRFLQRDSENGRHLLSYIPSFPPGYMRDVSHVFFLNLLMIVPISTAIVLLMKVEKGDFINGPSRGHITRGCLLGSISFLFCLLGIVIVKAFVERRDKMRNSLIEEVQILRNQNVLLRARLQMKVQRYLDETRRQVTSIPLS